MKAEGEKNEAVAKLKIAIAREVCRRSMALTASWSVVAPVISAIVLVCICVHKTCRSAVAAQARSLRDNDDYYRVPHGRGELLVLLNK
jgi:hypothetical protein